MPEGMFLGYKVNTDGLKVCPNKADAVLSLPSLICLKDVQKLNGKLASLNRFLSKSAEKSLPFFKTLKKCTKKSDFQWTQEAEATFKQMKKRIAKLPTLTAHKEKEELIIYLVAAKEAISAVLMTEREGKQILVYFMSRALRGTEIYYNPMEKLVLALLSASRRLKRYFQAHAIVVITDQPIKQLLSRASIKGQRLADFIMEWPEEESPDEPMTEPEEIPLLTTLIPSNSDVLIEELKEKSINEKEILAIVEEEGNTWMTPICEYLIKEILLADKKKARAVRRKAARYTMINGTLYKKSFLGPWLWCVGTLQENYVLREIHEGSCSMHSGPRSVVAKAIRTGYYWPTMHMDARKLIRECNDCQVHRPILRNPQQNLTPITSSWTFYKWGIDIAGPFPEGPGKVKFLIVAVDYFTKWIEAKPVATITGNQDKKFVWDNIVCRFGLPGEIVSDNGKQFRDNPFKDWCEKLCIRQCFASVKHPQTNGLFERENRSLGEGIKARLDERSKDWIRELSHVLWSHRTMIKSSNGETPFSLTYGTEAVIPVEIGMPMLRTMEVDPTKNDEALEINLDLIEEKMEQAVIQEAKSKTKMEKYYNSRVCGMSFKTGDMVYRNNDASHARDGGKLGPKWEGPYEVAESLGKGAYKLKDCKGNELPRTWNICNLKKCYIHEM
ncbi:reverse transcriptase domain-containing protein [Tanacetum coccineum]